MNVYGKMTQPTAIFIAALFAWLVLAVLLQASHGAQPQRTCRPPSITSAPLIASAKTYPLMRYRIGEELRSEAEATYAFRQSDEYIELQQLRGFRAGVKSMSQAIAARSAPAAGEAAIPDVSRQGANKGAEPFVSPFPSLSQHCGQCHSGELPKGDIWLDGSVRYDSPEMAEKRDAIVHAIRTGRMPPSLKQGERLSQEVRDEIEDEIHGVDAE